MTLALRPRLGRWQQRLTKIVICWRSAARYDHREAPKVGARHFRTPTLAPLTPIHRSAWKVSAPNFAMTAVSEVRYPQATPSNSKNTLFGRCAGTHNLGTVPPKIRQRPRIASRRRWAPKGAWEASSATGCLLSPHTDKGRKGSWSVCAFRLSREAMPPKIMTEKAIVEERTSESYEVHGACWNPNCNCSCISARSLPPSLWVRRERRAIAVFRRKRLVVNC